MMQRIQMTVIGELDRMSIVAREAYGDRGAVLMTRNERGALCPEVAKVIYNSKKRRCVGSLLN